MIFLWSIIGFLAGSLIEWLAHKHLLHNFSYPSLSHSHFSIHHRNCRHNEGYDSDYLSLIPKDANHGWNEIKLLVIGLILVSPLALVSIWLWLPLLSHTITYYFLHRKSHLEPEWGKRWMPWHWDHQMGKNQNANWGVTSPIFDWVFGTRFDKNGNKIKWQ